MHKNYLDMKLVKLMKSSPIKLSRIFRLLMIYKDKKTVGF